jgi:glycosyltransferase involved in cell wall biosynthesis
MEVTVLLTTYNHEKYIGQALDSVLMQKTGFDFEILVLEDCSTDRTQDILREYQIRHPHKIRLRLAARNDCHSSRPFAEAFRAISSPYIALLDGDDYWISSHKLQTQVEFLRAHPDCALCFHNALRVYEDEHRLPLVFNSQDQKPFPSVEDLWKWNFIAGCSPMLRKDAVGELPEWYEKALVGDWPLYILWAEQGKIGYIDEVLGVYRIHQTALWNQSDKLEKLERLIAVYEQMNANFNFRYDGIVQPLISKRKAELSLAQRTNELLTAHLPPKATVIVTSRPDEELPRLRSREVWPFPMRIHRDPRQIFASGATGSVEAPWIGSKGSYRFELFQAAKEKRLLASVAVSQNGGSMSGSSSNNGLTANNAYIIANPNPVPKVTGLGRTLISWSTGDGSPGLVEVVLEDQQQYYPHNSAAAIEEMEQLRSNGAEFLFVPSTELTLFQRYPELHEHVVRHYRLFVAEEELGAIYDLH